VNGGEELVVGGPVRFELRPVGCYSGTCTKIHDVSCQVGEASDDKFELRASFCLEDTSDSFTGCTADCGGGGLAECQVDSVGRGDYVATVDGLTLQFAVGSVLPSGGACVGR